MQDPLTLARRALAAFASGETGDAEAFIAPDYANLESADRSRAHGPAEFRETVAWMHRSFAALRFDEIAMQAGPDQAMAWVRLHGTHAGAFLGLAPSGRAFAVEQVHLFAVKDGRLTGHRALRDDLRLLLTLGARVSLPDGSPLAVHQR